MLTEALITGGLVMDVVGVVLIFRFGLPPPVSRGGHTLLALEGDDPKEAKKAQWFDRLSEAGALLVILGFALQIIGVWV